MLRLSAVACAVLLAACAKEEPAAPSEPLQTNGITRVVNEAVFLGSTTGEPCLKNGLTEVTEGPRVACVEIKGPSTTLSLNQTQGYLCRGFTSTGSQIIGYPAYKWAWSVGNASTLGVPASSTSYGNNSEVQVTGKANGRTWINCSIQNFAQSLPNRGLELAGAGFMQVGSAPLPTCLEGSCATVTNAYMSWYSLPGCKGTEYGNVAGTVRQNWDGKGLAGNLGRSVTVASTKSQGQGCIEAQQPFKVVTTLRTIYRVACGEASCSSLSAKPVGTSYFTNADCTGTESTQNSPRVSWDGRGIAGTTLKTLTSKSWREDDGGGDGSGCRRNFWPNGTVSNRNVIYR